jgi:hypothetical protein
MKIVITFVVGLGAGLAFGWFIGYLHPRRIADRQMEVYMKESEPSSRDAAIVAIHAIRQIQAGDTNMAIHILSLPLADYYYSFADFPDTNGDYAWVRPAIDGLVHTNREVAKSMKQAHQIMQSLLHGGGTFPTNAAATFYKKP